MKLVLLNEAKDFIDALPSKVSDKIYYNIRRVMKGERNRELFKKLEDTDIWEFRTLYDKTAYRLFAFWDNEKETLVSLRTALSKRRRGHRQRRSQKPRR